MTFKAIIVGAGIGGLTTAVSLRRAGWAVLILEKSAFRAEVGAALSVTPNGARVLSQLGFSYDRARACTIQSWETLDGATLNLLKSIDLQGSEKMFGEPARTVHRVDLHTELLLLATEAGRGEPAKLRLSSEVVDAKPEGTVTLRDGSVISGDLVVGADGLHSLLRDMVVGKNTQIISGSSDLAAFRFLVDTDVLRKDPVLAPLLDSCEGKAVSIINTKTEREHHVMWYPCRNGETQNFVGIHPKRTEEVEEGEAAKAQMRKEYSDYHENVDRILQLAEHVRCWPLFVPEPNPTWVRGRAVIIGDAAHPMLPFGGQGSNMAIEDAGALGMLLSNLSDSSQISERLELFERVRMNRATRVQILSEARVGQEKMVEEEVRKYAESGDILVPTTHRERTIHDYSYNVLAECEKVL